MVELFRLGFVGKFDGDILQEGHLVEVSGYETKLQVKLYVMIPFSLQRERKREREREEWGVERKECITHTAFFINQTCIQDILILLLILYYSFI